MHEKEGKSLFFVTHWRPAPSSLVATVPAHCCQTCSTKSTSVPCVRVNPLFVLQAAVVETRPIDTIA